MKLLITCGGTGGHIYPAIAIAQKTINKFEDIIFVGSQKRMEKDLVARENFKFFAISVSRKNPLVILYGFFQALILLIRYKPDRVLATGGYVTVPVIIAAALLRKKIFIQEQNRLPGKVNRFLSRFADTVFSGYPDNQKYFSKKAKFVFTGNPLREHLQNLSMPSQKSFHLLVMGGSLGAKAIDEWVLRNQGRFDFEYTHIHAGNYIHDMRPVYQKTSLILCRAGAMTLTEIAALGIPAILIPYPIAADDHQNINAEYFKLAGGAFVYAQNQLADSKVIEKILELKNNPENLKQMSLNMKKVGRTDSAEIIAKSIL
jgi:UDP-N-acetylglucosamine--N-acetylmuramyl-(pentapeptide) pyrophosphoryl-undecaprenol N-acetylglucosamine transferase